MDAYFRWVEHAGATPISVLGIGSVREEKCRSEGTVEKNVSDAIEGFLADFEQECGSRLARYVEPAAAGDTRFTADQNVLALERKRYELFSKVRSSGWERPFAALVLMGAEHRDLIRRTLNFSWGKDVIHADPKPDLRAVFEAWEIIDCHIRGIVARMHTMAEQVNPVAYLSWRQALVRTLELCGHSYRAIDADAALEREVMGVLGAGRKRSARGQTQVPGGLGRMHKKVGLVMEVLKDLASAWDGLLGSEEGPAIASIQSICEFLCENTKELTKELANKG